MPDVTAMKFSEMHSTNEGGFVLARASLGVKSFGMQVENMPAGWDGHPEHDESGDGQEEVYVPLSGSGTLKVGEEQIVLEPGMMVRIGPAEKRKIMPGTDGLQILCLGGIPGGVYQAPSYTEPQS